MPDLARPEELPALVAPVREAFDGADVWLVGGSVRDLLLRRPFSDWDLVAPGDPGRVARAYASRCGGMPFALSERHGAWRVVHAVGTVDVTTLDGSIEDDLARRDFTVNALALRVADCALRDPHGGLGDLGNGVLRPVSAGIFHDDPLRLLRLPRLAAELGLRISDEARELARRDAARASAAAGERQLAELMRLLAVGDPATALYDCESLGVLGAVLPEIAALRGVEQNPYHQLDVFEHTLHVVDGVADIAGNVAHYFPGDGGVAIDRQLAAPLDGTLDVRLALRFAALFHDVAKPVTRSVDDGGLVKFFGHERAGADFVRAAIGRLRGSRALQRFLETLVTTHLRLGFLVKQRPLDARTVYRYAVATRPYPHAAIVLSLADRLATRGPRTRLRGLRAHHELAREMAIALVSLGDVPPRTLVPGDALAHRLELQPGPLLGELVAALQEEQAAGAVTSAAEAEAFARTWLASRSPQGARPQARPET